jgi:hypothetical protein
VTAISRLWRFSGTDPQTSCALYNHLEPESRLYAMRPLSEQDTVPLHASPMVVYQHQKQFNDTPATSTQAESSRDIIYFASPPGRDAVPLYSMPFAGPAPCSAAANMETNIQPDSVHDGNSARAQMSDGYMITRSLGLLPPDIPQLWCFFGKPPSLVSECVC